MKDKETAAPTSDEEISLVNKETWDEMYSRGERQTIKTYEELLQILKVYRDKIEELRFSYINSEVSKARQHIRDARIWLQEGVALWHREKRREEEQKTMLAGECDMEVRDCQEDREVLDIQKLKAN